MTEHILPEYRYCCRVGTDINQCTSRTLLSLCQHHICQCQRSQIHICDLNIGCLKTFVQVLEERCTFKDIQEITFEVIGTDTHRIHLQLRINTILLLGNIQNLLVRIIKSPVCIHQFNNHLLCDNTITREIFHNSVLDTANRLATDTHEYLSDTCLQLCFQFLDDRCQTLSSLVNVVNNTLADE